MNEKPEAEVPPNVRPNPLHIDDGGDHKGAQALCQAASESWDTIPLWFYASLSFEESGLSHMCTKCAELAALAILGNMDI